MRKVRYKSTILSLIVLLAFAGGVFAQDHFEPVEPTGVSYSIIILDALIDDVQLVEFDEVAVFDGELCVGATQISEGWDWVDPLDLIAWAADPGNELPGFTAGNEMSFMLWSPGQNAVDATAEYVEGNGTFADGPFAVLSLSATGPGGPTLTVDPTDYNFGEVLLDVTSTTNITLSNDGGQAITVTVGYVGDAAFTIDPEGDVVVAPGGDETIQVSFTPTEEIDYAGTIEITSQLGNEAVTLSGAGTLDRHFDPVDPTGIIHTFTINSAMVIYEDDIEEDLNAGDEIAIYDGNLCVGSILLQDPVEWPMTILAHGDNELDENGWVEGNEVSFRVFEANNNRELLAEAQNVEGPMAFTADGETAADLVASFANVTNFYNSVTILGEMFANNRWYRDGGNVAALDGFATDTYDPAYDAPEPRAPASRYLTVFFPHGGDEGWDNPFGSNFMVDVRNGNDDLSNDMKVFDFDVRTDFIGPTVNLTFNINEDYDDDLGVVLYDEDEDVWQNLRDSNIYSFTGAGAQVTRHFQLYLGDSTPPEVDVEDPVEGDTLIVGQPYIINWFDIDISVIYYIIIEYSSDDGVSWTQIDQIFYPDFRFYEWTPPDIYSVYTRIRITMMDIAGNVVIYSPDYVFNIAPNSRVVGFAPNWHLFSLPLMLDVTEVGQIFGVDPGPMWVYDYTAAQGYGFVEDMYHGPGYWLANTELITLTINGESELEQTNLALNQDWNIVGAALPTTVSKWDLAFSDGEQELTFQEAVDALWISPTVYRYDNVVNTYRASDNLAQWKGYWLQGVAAGIEMITYPPYPGPHAEGFVEEEGDELDEDTNGWFQQITTTMGDVSDHLAGFGVNVEATDGFDIWHDVVVPPTPANNEFVRVVFDHQEWRAPVGSRFSIDIREDFNLGEELSWFGTVEASGEGRVSMSFNGIADKLPQGINVFMIHGNSVVNLIENPVVSFNYDEPYQFEIRITDATSVAEANDGIPTVFAIESAFPNPFNPSVSIVVAVPEITDLTAVVYDVMGRQVATLQQGEVQPGHLRLNWHAEGPSGIYFLRVDAESGWTGTQKLMFLK
ncbi:T9SS type A sorting domain-containing protein [bacterium]|nr:T9SS type A sorting domain-containing protein [bacterium]